MITCKNDMYRTATNLSFWQSNLKRQLYLLTRKGFLNLFNFIMLFIFFFHLSFVKSCHRKCLHTCTCIYFQIVKLYNSIFCFISINLFIANNIFDIFTPKHVQKTEWCIGYRFCLKSGILWIYILKDVHNPHIVLSHGPEFLRHIPISWQRIVHIGHCSRRYSTSCLL